MLRSVAYPSSIPQADPDWTLAADLLLNQLTDRHASVALFRIFEQGGKVYEEYLFTARVRPTYEIVDGCEQFLMIDSQDLTKARLISAANLVYTGPCNESLYVEVPR